MANLRLKVRKDVLLANAKAKRAAMVEAHKRAVEKWTASAIDERGIIIDALEAMSVRVAAGGKLPEFHETYNAFRRCYETLGVIVPVKGIVRGEKPKLDTSRIDKHIGFLEAAADETITLSVDHDLSQYL